MRHLASEDGTALTAQRMLLRQLAVGFGVSKLYPGDPTTSAFVAAADRIVDAARTALATGPLSVEVRSGRFVVGDTPVDDEITRRLSQACYERRVEYVTVATVPSREELSRWFQLLGRAPHEIEDEGGMGALVGAAGITAIRSAAGVPETATGEEVEEHLLGLADWMQAVPEEPSSEEVAELTLRAGESAEALYGRLRELSDRITTDGSVRSTFFRRAARLVDELPDDEEAAFGRLVIERVADESFAERYAGHLTDPALATMILAVAAHHGRDPVGLAQHVSQVAERHDTLVRLVASLVDEAAPDPAPIPTADDPPLGPPAPDTPTERAAIAVDLSAVETAGTAIEEDHRELIEIFPDDPAEGRALALTALVDVMGNDPRPDHVSAILDNLVRHLRRAVVSGDAILVADLLGTLQRGAEVGTGEVVAAIERGWASVLTGQVVAEAATSLAREGRRLDTDVLVPFGAAAVGPLMAALEEDLAEQIQRQLHHLLASLGDQHPTVLQDQVVRRRPEVLARLLPVVVAAAPGEVMPLLSRLALRTEPQVHAALADVLPRQPAGPAAPLLGMVARRARDSALQRRCLEALAGMGPAGQATLADLAAGREEPRLPWRRRRLARRLARRGGR